jgi:fucose permease
MWLAGASGILSIIVKHSPTRAGHQALTLGLASLGFVSLGLPEGLLGVAWPSIRATFDLPLDALGLLLATFASGYFVSSAFSGRVIARLGVGLALAASCAVTGVSLLGYALAPAWPPMVALGVALGLGAGTIDAGLNTYAAVAHGPRVLNWMHAAFGVGAAVGPLVMTALLSSGLPWSSGYVIVAAAQMSLAVGYGLTRQRYINPPPSLARGQEPSASGQHSARAMLARPLIWLSLLLFFVYVGIEAAAGQWSFSLFTLARGTPAQIAGVLVSAYWACLTLGRLAFGVLITRISSDTVLRACMLVTVLAAGVIWLNVPLVSWLAVGLLGLVLAPVFPVLIADTPRRLGAARAADAIGLQVAAAVAGGAAIPAGMGVLAARLGLEVIGPCLVGAALVQLVLHEALIRRACEPPQSARSRSNEAASFPPGA